MITRASVVSVRSPRVSKGYFGNWPSLTVGLLTRLRSSRRVSTRSGSDGIYTLVSS
jgi:hypothetical protein